MTLSEFGQQLATISGANVYHYFAPPNKGIPFIVWRESSRDDFIAEQIHAEKMYNAYVHLFTKTENDDLISSIETLLDSLQIAWKADEILYEEDTGVLHFVWLVSFYG